jgi:hypothetical protein
LGGVAKCYSFDSHGIKKMRDKSVCLSHVRHNSWGVCVMMSRRVFLGSVIGWFAVGRPVGAVRTGGVTIKVRLYETWNGPPVRLLVGGIGERGF